LQSAVTIRGEPHSVMQAKPLSARAPQPAAGRLTPDAMLKIMAHLDSLKKR
jgi:hypothetical protein